MKKFILLVLILFSYIGLTDQNILPVTPVRANAASYQESGPHSADLELAQKYAPVFYFHTDEIYHPQPVDVVLDISRLRHSVRMWFDTTILSTATLQGLLNTPSDETSFLDQWFGDANSSEYTNYNFKRAIYETIYSPHTGGPQPAVYAHVVRDETPGYITIQYWIFYFYNDWFNKHEGDWELVEVILRGENQPEWVIYSQHHGGVRRSWVSAPVEQVTHPVVYVARGSHANYTVANEVYPHGQAIGNRRIVLVDRTGTSERMLPDVILIPTRDELAADPGTWSGAEWLMFRGRWGETGFGDFTGPYGPADKGIQWEAPLVWGIGQPLDAETWFENRMRVEFAPPDPSPIRITLTDLEGQPLPLSESVDNLAVLHTEPPEVVLADIDGAPGTRGEVTVYWPDRASETVTRMNFDDLALDETGHAQLELSAGKVFFLAEPNRLALQPSLVETSKAIWDAPDSIWVGSYLPFTQITGGLLSSLLISLVPVLILIAILYWIDQYHKEPVRVLALAFLWGAIPALLISLGLQWFIKLPSSVMSPGLLQAIRLGLFAPVLEETLKAAGVLFIYWRRPREINDVLDGMIYGAIVGFGFAFVSNLSRYAGNFIAWGYSGLSAGLIAERTVNALDHGLYTAIFGAGVGFAMLARSRWQFWTRVMAALVLSIATHALHNLFARSLVGLNLLTVIVTTAGTLLLWVIAGWSLVQQRRLLQTELQGVIHDSLYRSILSPRLRLKAQLDILRRQGWHAWIQVRHLQNLCIQLATLRLEAHLSPGEDGKEDKAQALQAEIGSIFDGLYTAVS